MPAPKKIVKLVERFDDNVEAYKKGKYNETQLRREFIDPFFEQLGWDVANKKGYAEPYKEVIHEDAIRVGRATKAPDYSFRIGGVRKFFVEAKKPSVDIKEDTHPAYQLRRYAWSAKLPLSILTDFEEFAVYDCRVKPVKTDKASHSRILYLTYRDYLERWDQVFGIFSREAILKGSFDKYVESKKAKRGTAEVDSAFLEEIERWRDLLARNIAMRNPELTQRELNFAVQRTIDRVIFLRICEDRGIEPYGRLRSLLSDASIYHNLFDLFRLADGRYNSGLFYFKPEKGRPQNHDSLTPSLSIDDKHLKNILKNLYYPDSAYEFSVLPADILGQVYERFLGKVIRLTPTHRAIVEDKPEVKKAGGVYYTPTHIVSYIVGETVGKLLKGKKPGPRGTVSKFRILDPACGSGSFLLEAYQYLLDWHRDQYVKDGPQNWARGRKPHLCTGRSGDWRLTTAERKRILLNNIYGVDIDPQAVEVTKLSLLLKVLEGEDEETLNQQLKLFRERALPSLSNNIKCGNSLIGPDFFKNKQMSLLDEEEMLRINAFSWESEFEEIMSAGGFDAVIGNPPWGATLTTDEKQYLSEAYEGFLGNYDSYLFFIERAFSLAKARRRVSFVTPDTWITVPQSRGLRKTILRQGSVESITVLPSKVFKGVSANCIVFVLRRVRGGKSCEVRILSPKSDLALLNDEQFDDRYDVKVAFWKQSDDLQFQVYQRNEIAGIIHRVRSTCVQAVKCLDVMQGIVPYSRENHSEQTVTKRLFHSTKKLSTQYGPWIQGRCISRYHLEVSKKEYLKYGDWLHRPRKRKYFEGPRILVQEITGGHPPKISACHCDTVLYHDPGIISCLNIGDFHILFMLGILNSRFLSWYHRHSSPKGTRQAFAKVLIGDIRKFPIPTLRLETKRDRASHDRMAGLVKEMLRLGRKLENTRVSQAKIALNRQMEALDRQIDRLVYKLYGLTKGEVDIVEGNSA
jgi:hypothetical protein